MYTCFLFIKERKKDLEDHYGLFGKHVLKSKIHISHVFLYIAYTHYSIFFIV